MTVTMCAALPIQLVPLLAKGQPQLGVGLGEGLGNLSPEFIHL